MSLEIVIGEGEEVPEALDRVIEVLRDGPPAVALTGAGVSVDSGIPDFRSPTGLWSRFDPQEYATLSCFLLHPEKAWELFRALGRSLAGTRPNPAHEALAALERDGLLAGVVTQNVDGLHQAAGSRNVLELHGSHERLQCLQCGRREPITAGHLEPGPIPRCGACDFPLKPDVVLFEEPVREADAVQELVDRCETLLVAGTSAEVVPASLLPDGVLLRGGRVIELNREPTRLTAAGLGPHGLLLRGSVALTLPLLARRWAGAR